MSRIEEEHTEHISKIPSSNFTEKRIEDEYIKMEKRYRNSYSIETESILSESLKHFPQKFQETFPETFPMMVLRNCAKMFFINEIEACQLVILIKDIGWEPSAHINGFKSKFNPPACFLEPHLSENIVFANPIIINIMVMCCTAKKLLNDRHISLIILNYIEQRCFDGFGKLFNVWIKYYESDCKVNMKKINKIYSNILKAPRIYAFPEARPSFHKQIAPQPPQEDPILPQLTFAEHSSASRKMSASSLDQLGSWFDHPYNDLQFSSSLS